MSKQITAKFPAMFAEDHYWRELPCGKLSDENSRYHTFLIEDGKCGYVHEDRMLTAKEVLEEWASDADYYVEMDHLGGFDPDMKPLCRSAARTLRIANALLKEHFPSGETK
tara:strand:+ start:273 stop:605 length:333 start_codon:yes stop_codon:yes gene_type:complete